MNWFLKLFKRKSPTNYPPQVLSDRQLYLIEVFDSFLVNLHPNPALEHTQLKVKAIELPLQYQYYSNERLVNLLTKDIKKSQGYIPRSVALIVDESGTWIFIYGTRETTGSTKPTTQMFIECLNRTNNTRK